MMNVLAKILPALAGGLLLAGIGAAAPAVAQDTVLADWKPRDGYHYGPPPRHFRGPPPRHYRGPPPRYYRGPPPSAYYAPPPVYYAPPRYYAPPPRYYRPAPPPGVGLYFRF
jgi:hypothetical protein